MQVLTCGQFVNRVSSHLVSKASWEYASLACQAADRGTILQVLMRNARKQLSVENGGQAAAVGSETAAHSSSAIADGHAAFADAITPEQQTAPARRDIDLRTYDEVLCLLHASICWITHTSMHGINSKGVRWRAASAEQLTE